MCSGIPRTNITSAKVSITCKLPKRRATLHCVQDALTDTSLMPYRLTVAVLMLDIETEWTLNTSLTTSSSYRKCSKRRTLDHSAQATSRLRIEDTTKCWRIALGLSSGNITASAADLSFR
jgi:hypothetical protein